MSVLLKESSEPITRREQLAEYFAQAGKLKSEWRIGCEHEKFPYRLSTLKPVGYDGPQGLRDLLTGMQHFGWKPSLEDGHIIGLSRGHAAISMEPGGQFELAGAPLVTLHEVAAENDQHLAEVNEIGAPLDIGFLGMGFHPTARRAEIPWMPKNRYRIMREYMPKKGKLGLDMMLRTCTVQVNLDFADEADMVKKYRVALALQPIATALFASSPFTEGKPNDYNSYRMHVWTDTDPDRCGAPEFVFEDGFGFERYTEYALDVPMYFIYRNGKYIDCTGQSFRAFLDGKLPAAPGELPTLGDWANHLTTLFPDVRLKKVLELRGADAGDAAMLLALPALWVGLLYDNAACDAAWDLVKGWTSVDRKRLHDDVSRLGFKAEIRGRKAADVAHDIILLAQQGLRRRAHMHNGADEARYLDALLNLTESRRNRSDWLLEQYAQDKNFSMRKVFDEGRLKTPNASEGA
jgi:glutamate--cysteine ligase